MCFLILLVEFEEILFIFRYPNLHRSANDEAAMPFVIPMSKARPDLNQRIKIM